MRKPGRLGKRERAAVEAVAGHVGAAWEEGRGASPAVSFAVGGKRIAVEVAAINGEAGATKMRLRFDKVVLRLVGGLRDALSEAVPDGQAVIVTVTAPIRLPGKTAEALEATIRERLARRSFGAEVKDTIHGNRVRVRRVKGVTGERPKVIGFVHNPDCDPDILMRLTQSLLQHPGTSAGGEPGRGKVRSDRWLVVADAGGLPYVETYRHVCSQLSLTTEFQKILLVLAGGRVETLAG